MIIVCSIKNAMVYNRVHKALWVNKIEFAIMSILCRFDATNKLNRKKIRSRNLLKRERAETVIL